MIEEVKKLAFELLSGDSSGHGADHVLRVYDLALKFAETEGANQEIVALAVLLHDVDDYKLFGKESSENLTNAKKIMSSTNINNNTQEAVLDIIRTMGYSKYLKGIRPTSLEGKIVSDADMCDAIGANGIVRNIVYAVSGKGSGIIFDKNTYPNVDITHEQYNSGKENHSTNSAINHFFEKLLKLKDLMMTESGKKEAIERQQIMVDFLKHFFKEENAPEWIVFLEKFLKGKDCKER